MKRFLLIVLLMGPAVQANGLKETWNNFGKDNRTISGGKVLVAGYLAYAAVRSTLEQSFTGYGLARYDDWGWFDALNDEDYEDSMLSEFYLGRVKAEMVPRHLVMAGLSGYAAYLLSKQVWHDAKQVFSGKEPKKV